METEDQVGLQEQFDSVACTIKDFFIVHYFLSLHPALPRIRLILRLSPSYGPPNGCKYPERKKQGYPQKFPQMPEEELCWEPPANFSSCSSVVRMGSQSCPRRNTYGQKTRLSTPASVWATGPMYRVTSLLLLELCRGRVQTGPNTRVITRRRGNGFGGTTAVPTPHVEHR